MAVVRQTSFSGGELSPMLHGRTDLAKYAVGLRRCRDFFISRHGAAVSRPGMQFLGEVGTLLPLNPHVRLIPFIFSDDTSYVLEFRESSILAGGVLTSSVGLRIWSNGELVESGGSPINLSVSAFTFGALPQVKHAQSGNVMVLTHPGYTPQVLTRVAHDDWTIEDLTFDIRPFFGREAEARTPLPTADATHPAVPWNYVVTALGVTEKGEVFESAPVAVVQDDSDTSLPSELVIYPDLPFHLDFTHTLHANPADMQTFLGYNIYRGRSGVFGYAGTTVGQSVPSEWTDNGQEPDYTRPPPQGRNPFDVLDAAGTTVVRTEEPATVAYFEGRRVFGGTEERWDRLFASATNSYGNFDEQLVATADGPVEFELAARRREEIRALLGLDRLLIFTQSSVWAAGGAGGAPLAPTDLIEARVQQEVGSAWVDPLVVGNSVLFVRAKGTGVRDLAYDERRRAYAGGDLSIIAQHLFEGHTITEWAYQEDPWGVVWAVRDDGALLSLTYDPAYEVWAWALHETDGVVESVCVVPEETEDVVYLAVRRTVGGTDYRYVERFASRVVSDVADAVCLDSAITYEGAATDTITGLHHLEGLEVYALADGQVQGPFTVDNGQVTLTAAASKVHVGLPFTPELELLDLAVARDKRKRVGKVTIEVVDSRGLSAGEDTEHLTAWAPDAVWDDYDAAGLHTGEVEIRIGSTWNRYGRAVVRQTQPLPVTVVGVTREVEGGS